MAAAALIRALSALARSAARRLRVNAALRALALVLPLPLTIALASLTFVKLMDPEPSITARLALVLAGVGLIAAGLVLHALLARRPWTVGALALDRHYGLKDRVTNALSFSALPEDQQTPLMRAAIADAQNALGKIKPAQAVPWSWPKELWVSALLLGLLLLLSRFEVSHSQRLARPAQEFTPLVLVDDDLQLLRETGVELLTQTDDPEVTAAVQRFNQLVEDLAEHRLDRREVFRRLGELERQALAGLELDGEALNEGLEGLARELQKSSLSKPTAEALKEQRLADAEQALRELAERLKQTGQSPDRAALDELRKALEQASQQGEARLARLEAQRAALEQEQQRLLKRKQQGQASSADGEAEQNNRRKLERLKREQSRAEKAKQQLSQLDKELAKAARELFEQLGQAAQSLESGASELGRAAQQQLTREQKLELKRQLEQLRDMLRQQGKAGQDQQERLRQFADRARGGRSGSRPKPGDANEPGKERPGGKLRLGMGSQQIELPGGAGADTPGEGQQPGGEAPGTGPEAGKGAGPELQGEASALEKNAKNVSAAGADSGQGTASSEVVFGAAERGFTSSRYREVYTDYRTVAEEVIAHDDIPPGYKFYVRRYFQLIRPRE